MSETIPRGLGIYCGRVTSVGSAFSTGRLIERLQRARARHVGLCVEATDGWRPKRSQIATVVEGLASAGIQVHAYALPGRDRARRGRQVADELLTLTQGLPLAGYQLDAEEAYRGLPEELEACAAALIDGATERTTVGITTYGLPSEGGSFPWPSIVGLGYLVWQAYERSSRSTKVRAGVDELRESWGAGVLPAVASYDRKSIPAGELNDGPARLLADLRRACTSPASGKVDVPGAWVWSDGSLEHRELDALGDWVLAAAGWL